MRTMSDDIKLSGQIIDCNSMSGDISLTNCTGNVETMSGDIFLKRHYANNVKSMSGDCYIEDSRVNHIETMSGDIHVCRGMCRTIETLSGDVTLNKMSVNTVRCSELFGENSDIMTLIIIDNSSYMKVTSGFKWWNPATWFNNNQIQYCGNNSTCFQSNGDMFIVKSENGKVYKDGKCITKSNKPRVFILPDTIRVDKVIFDNCREDNIVKSKRKVIVENGKWQKV